MSNKSTKPYKPKKSKPDLPPKVHRDPAGATLLAAVMNSELLGDREKAIYQIIFNRGPISAEEIETATGHRNIWNIISPLRARKMITEGQDHTLTSNGRRTKTWITTSNPPAANPLKPSGAAKVRNHYNGVRPTRHEIAVFARDIAVLLALSNSKGARISLNTRKIQKWLLDGAPCPTCNHHKSNHEHKETK